MISCSSSSRVRRLPSLLVDDGLLRVAGDQPVLLGNPRMLLRLVRSADRLAADRVAAVLESGGINPSESARNNQSQSVEKSQCANLLLPG